MYELTVVCPAAEPIAEVTGVPAARCRITHDTIDVRQNPKTLLGSCAGAYTGCGTWVTEKDRIAAGTIKRMVEEREGEARIR